MKRSTQSGLKANSSRLIKKINPKNFTEEQAIEIALRQKCKCGVCNKRAAKLNDDNEILWMANVHHIKYKSVLNREDLEKHGTAGGTLNGVLVCQTPCHDRIHDMDPELARFRSRSFQEIGQTEEDLRKE